VISSKSLGAIIAAVTATTTTTATADSARPSPNIRVPITSGVRNDTTPTTSRPTPLSIAKGSGCSAFRLTSSGRKIRDQKTEMTRSADRIISFAEPGNQSE
jgi:hypothetical protein